MCILFLEGQLIFALLCSQMYLVIGRGSGPSKKDEKRLIRSQAACIAMFCKLLAYISLSSYVDIYTKLY